MNQKGFSPLFIILGIILVLGIAGGAYYFGTSQIPKTQPQRPIVASQTSQPTPISSITPNINPVPNAVGETANWKTYTDPFNSFSIKYPPEWNVLGGSTANPGQEIIEFGPNLKNPYQDPNTKVSISTQPPNSTIKSAIDYKNSILEQLSKDKSASDIVNTTINLDGISGFKVSNTYAKVKRITVLIDKSNLIYSIDLTQPSPYSDEDLSNYQEMLSSFKFTN